MFFAPKNWNQRFENSCSLLYPPEWLAARPQDELYCQLKSNKDIVKNLFDRRCAHLPKMFGPGIRNQQFACFTHSVSANKLKKIKESGIKFQVITGDVDLVRVSLFL